MRDHDDEREEGCLDFGSEVAGLSEAEAFELLGLQHNTSTSGVAAAGATGNGHGDS